MAELLVVEDDEAIGAALTASLRQHGYALSWQRTGHAALAAAAVRPFDLVVLDLGLPDLDGMEVCRRLRALQADLVVVVLTARAEEMDVVLALEAGADDYLTKPFRLAELHARLRAHLRRVTVAPSSPGVLTVGTLVVDVPARRARVGERELRLRAKELDLLARLAAEPGAAVSRETLMAEVWDTNWFGSTKTLDVHVAALRRKIAGTDEPEVGTGGGRDGDLPVITTLRGHGYRLEVPGGDPAQAPHRPGGAGGAAA